MQYNFALTSAVSLLGLESEISDSGITIALASVITEGANLIIDFKADLTEQESVNLTSIVDAHDISNWPDPEATMTVSFPKSTPEKIPYVYATSKPLDHYVCFQGAGDLPKTQTDDGIGMGKKLSFNLASTDDRVTKDYTFNEMIYLKDGYVIVKDAPLGACFDVDIIHPLDGLIQTFARRVPLYQNSWIPLNTEDRALIPQGLIIRITVYNAAGGISDDEDVNFYEDSPATFAFSARLELYRPMARSSTSQ